MRGCFPTQGGFCNANGPSVMTCLVPNTTSDLTSNISYTVRFGSAPGPDLTSVELTLDLRPNPVFAENGSALVDNEFLAGEGGLLEIKVSLSVSDLHVCCRVAISLSLSLSLSPSLSLCRVLISTVWRERRYQ